ncbi:hypothetical protein MTO96_035682 [Rhipicephalus appendiculatus]
MGSTYFVVMEQPEKVAVVRVLLNLMRMAGVGTAVMKQPEKAVAGVVQASYASCQPAPRVAAPRIATGWLVSRWGGHYLHDAGLAETLVKIDKPVLMKEKGKIAEFETPKKLLQRHE